MDGCSFAALIPNPDQLKTALSVAGSIVISASLFISMTPTPPPGTWLARVYRVIEIAALVFSHAKETGALPALPQLDKSLQEAIDLVKNHREPPL
jgi:hypothetical protein